MRTTILILFCCCLYNACAQVPDRVAIHIDENIEGAPITLGIPFPKGKLSTVDNIRLLMDNGREIPCQTTEVTNWLPADDSVKWAWVFFFAEKTDDYILEFGEGMAPIQNPERIVSVNNMRPGGGIQVNTGPLSLLINKSGDGFLDEVYLDSNKDGSFGKEERIASAPEGNRGTFLDILDDAGIDASKAIINEVFREKGSGPMHSIFRIEGTYVYNRDDNNISPFSMRLHAYAGKSYVRILHTLTYTGVPDKHKIQEGEHANIATQNNIILSEDSADDPGWTQPNDQIAGCGLQLHYHLDENAEISIPMHEGNWQENGPIIMETLNTSEKDLVQLLQTGPERNNGSSLRSLYMNRFEKSSLENQTPPEKSFEANLSKGQKQIARTEKAKGWMNITDGNRGVAIGVKNFLKEYPKGISIDLQNKKLFGNIWPADAGPMSFERSNTEMDGGMLGNFAQGITKTTEFIYYFHDGSEEESSLNNTMDYVLNSPVAHAEPKWYMDSKVYGNMAPFSIDHPKFENALQYKYEWWSFNQNNQPWYGMFDYGDGKTYFFDGKWYQWTNNEPTIDFMLWTNFMRTGNSKYYHMAQAMSRHTMDVDNVHWPKKRTYLGEINDAVDFWNFEDEPESTPYLGIGRRHANEHWNALLSAHVWIQGWIASYYLSGDHRALEIAKMTGDTYINRIWGEHDLRGRRLYLSVLNLVELYDATKLQKYKSELDERVDLMLELQKEQGGNIILDRYGYSQPYVALGLYKYWQITGREDIKRALVEHARWVRDVPPLNHEMESYLATINPLLIGYEFSGRKSFLEEAIARAEVLKVSKLEKEIFEFKDVEELNKALLEVSNLPKSSKSLTNWEINQGLRVFGWTHAYNIPQLLYWMENHNEKNLSK